MRARPSGIPTVPLSEFVRPGSGFWDVDGPYQGYWPGEHVLTLGPTGYGKTYLNYRLLGAVASPRLPALALVIKPKDKTAARFARELDMPIRRAWPLMPNPVRRKTPGHTIWPRHTMDAELDDQVLNAVSYSVLRDSYKRGKRLLFTDELAGFHDLELPKRPSLMRQVLAILRRGRSLELGLFATSQRPVEIPRDAYTNASHVFLGNDPDAAGRKRYDEIGGVDANVVRDITASLRRGKPDQGGEWLYIGRYRMNAGGTTPSLVIITPE